MLSFKAMSKEMPHVQLTHYVDSVLCQKSSTLRADKEVECSSRQKSIISIQYKKTDIPLVWFQYCSLDLFRA